MKRTSLVAALGTLLLLAGCRTVAPLVGPALAAAGSSYSAGKATQEFAQPLAAVQAAIAGALEDLQVTGVRQRHDGPARIFEATTADGRALIATLRPSVAAARVTVRVGWFGDEPFSRALMDRIGVRLGLLPPTAIPSEPPSTPAANPFFSRGAIPDALMFRDHAEAPFRDSLIPRD